MEGTTRYRCMYCLEPVSLNGSDQLVCSCGKKTSIKMGEKIASLVIGLGMKNSSKRIRDFIGIYINAYGSHEMFNGVENIPITGEGISDSITGVRPDMVFTTEAIEEVGLTDARIFIESEQRRVSYITKTEIPFWVIATVIANTFDHMSDG